MLRKEKYRVTITLDIFYSDVSFVYCIMTLRKWSERQTSLQKCLVSLIKWVFALFPRPP